MVCSKWPTDHISEKLIQSTSSVSEDAAWISTDMRSNVQSFLWTQWIVIHILSVRSFHWCGCERSVIYLRNAGHGQKLRRYCPQLRQGCVYQVPRSLVRPLSGMPHNFTFQIQKTCCWAVHVLEDSQRLTMSFVTEASLLKLKHRCLTNHDVSRSFLKLKWNDWHSWRHVSIQ